MADRPLRPATDRRLGRPLPHQLANQAQATPMAHRCFEPQLICGISPSFPGLSPTSGHIPTCYSPVRRSHCWAHDLHVLSMPPAFTLSQDQTLKFISITNSKTVSNTSRGYPNLKTNRSLNPSHEPVNSRSQHNHQISSSSQRQPRIPPKTTPSLSAQRRLKQDHHQP